MAGPDRIATAIEISKASFPRDRTALSVVLARADEFSDALVGAPLARWVGGPLLLTGGQRLDPRTATEIDRLIGPADRVVMLGGTNALGTLVEAEVILGGRSPERVAGSDRYETAVRVAERMDARFGTMLADGLSLPDALCAAGMASTRVRFQGPPPPALLLSAGSDLPEPTRAYIAANAPVAVAIGPGAAAAAPDAFHRFVGRDRYETCALAAQLYGPRPDSARRPGDPAVEVGLASGLNGVDALGGAVHISARGGFLLLVPPDDLTAQLRTYLADRKEGINDGWVYGGPSAISSRVVLEIVSLISGCSPGPGSCPA